MEGYLALAQLGFRVYVMDPLDYAAFVAEPKIYMEKVYGTMAANLYSAETDIEAAVEAARRVLEEPRIEVTTRIPARLDIGKTT